MKFCDTHWQILRDEVRELGLEDWVASSGETAVAQLVDGIQRREHTVVNYDPLMAAHNMIFGRVLEGLGLIVMAEDLGCPICFLNDRRSDDGACTCGHPDCPNAEPGSLPDFETWLRGPDGAVSAARNYMVEQGWIEADR